MQDDKWFIDGKAYRWTFGKHQGVLLTETPQRYLEWVRDAFRKGPLRTAVRRELERRDPSLRVVLGEPFATTVPVDSIQGQFEDHDHFDPELDWPGRQDWDGETAPWLDQLKLSTNGANE